MGNGVKPNIERNGDTWKSISKKKGPGSSDANVGIEKCIW